MFIAEHRVEVVQITRFRRTFYFHINSQLTDFDPEKGGSNFLRDVSILFFCIRCYTQKQVYNAT